MRHAPNGPVADILGRLDKVKPVSGGWTARCPAHDDKNPSLSISEGTDGRALLHCHAGCTVDAILAAIRADPSELFPPRDSNGHKPSVQTMREIEAYTYVDETGNMLYQAVRYEPKTFRQRRPDGNGGWAWSLADTRRVLYRLPAVVEAIADGVTIYICEGEKDVHALEQAGAVATTNAMGAKAWRDDYADQLTGAAQVIVVADNDDAGRAHAATVAQSLTQSNIPNRTVVAATGKDAHDHIAAGHTLDELVPLTAPGSWQPVDLNDDQYATPPAPPDLHPLIYSGLRHAISGPPEATKTLLSYAILLDIVRDGHTVAIVDFEMGANAARILLDDLGATRQDRSRILYFQDVTGPPDAADIAYLQERGVVAVLIDSSVGAFDASGLDDNARKDVEAWAKAWIRPLFNRGIATITLDHVTKNADTRGKFTIGSERKVGGVDVHLGAETTMALRRGSQTTVKLLTHKDRRGFLNRPHAYFIDITSDPETHRLAVTFREAEKMQVTAAGDMRPTIKMDQVSRWLEQAGEPQSRNAIEKGVGGNAATCRKAIEVLIAEGYCATVDGPNNSKPISLIRAYSKAAEEAAADIQTPRFGQFVPGSSEFVQDARLSVRPGSSPPYRGTSPDGRTKTRPGSSIFPDYDEAEIARLEELARTYAGDTE